MINAIYCHSSQITSFTEPWQAVTITTFVNEPRPPILPTLRLLQSRLLSLSANHREHLLNLRSPHPDLSFVEFEVLVDGLTTRGDSLIFLLDLSENSSPPATGRGNSLLTCGDMEENPSPVLRTRGPLRFVVAGQSPTDASSSSTAYCKRGRSASPGARHRAAEDLDDATPPRVYPPQPGVADPPARGPAPPCAGDPLRALPVSRSLW